MKYLILCLAVIVFCCVPRSEDASFVSFLNEFSSNKSFQLSRIAFPLEYIHRAQVPDTAIINTTLSADQYEHTEFPPDSVTTRYQYGAYQSSIHTEENQVTIDKEGIDNGIYVTYVFKKIDNKWFLVKIVNMGD